MLDCARAAPLWTGDANPYVLAASIEPGGRALALARVDHRCVWRDGVRHVLLDMPGGTLQLDVSGPQNAASVIPITPCVDLRRDVRPQLRSIQRLASWLDDPSASGRADARVSRLVAALRVVDALSMGASQREIGIGIFGVDWPGDGEHLKSRVRRMIPFAAAMVRHGPRAILQERY